jgi:enhancing lycopene biosynthesis protein 2
MFYRSARRKRKEREDIYSVSEDYGSKYVPCKAVVIYCDKQNNIMNTVYSFMYYNNLHSLLNGISNVYHPKS